MGAEAIVGRYEVARTPERLAELYAFRYRIFVEVDRVWKETPERVIADRFDDLSDNVVAIVDDRIVAAIRLTSRSAVSNNEDYLDFTPYLPPHPAVCRGSSILCVDERYRQTRLVAGLMGLTFHVAKAQGITHMYALARAQVSSFFFNMGFVPLMEEQYRADRDVRCYPALLDLDRVKPAYSAFVDELAAHHGGTAAIERVPFVLEGRNVRYGCDVVVAPAVPRVAYRA